MAEPEPRPVGAVGGMGRSTMGSVFLHDSRYTSFSVYLVIGLAGLLAVVIDEERLPAGGCQLRAWGYDATRHAAQPLEHTQDSRQLAPR